MKILKNLYYHRTLKLNTKVFIMLFHSLGPGRCPRAEVFKFIFKQQNTPLHPPMKSTESKYHRVSQLQSYGYPELRNLCPGAVLCVVGCSATFLASTI